MTYSCLAMTRAACCHTWSTATKPAWASPGTATTHRTSSNGHWRRWRRSTMALLQLVEEIAEFDPLAALNLLRASGVTRFGHILSALPPLISAGFCLGRAMQQCFRPSHRCSGLPLIRTAPHTTSRSAWVVLASTPSPGMPGGTSLGLTTGSLDLSMSAYCVWDWGVNLDLAGHTPRTSGSVTDNAAMGLATWLSATRRPRCWRPPSVRLITNWPT